MLGAPEDLGGCSRRRGDSSRQFEMYIHLILGLTFCTVSSNAAAPAGLIFAAVAADAYKD